MKPLVSILIPVHNGEKYLKEAIHSALEQKYEHTEIVVVDDHSTDQSLAIAESFHDPKIRFYVNEGPGGPAQAFNRCIELARGDYFCILHQDDRLHPDYVAAMLDYIISKNATAVHCPAWHLDASGKIRGSFFNAIKYRMCRRHPCLDLQRIKPLFKYDLIMCPTVFYDRKKMKPIGPFSTKLKMAVDYEMWFRILLNDGVIWFLDTRLYYYRYHEGMDTKKHQKNLKKYDEDYEIKRVVRTESLKKGIKLSRFLLERTILTIVIKDALIDLRHLNLGDFKDKIKWMFRRRCL